jgi:BirA family biotin operon repressor/biotin-[acetyl-CoA-carboxylase] ligase
MNWRIEHHSSVSSTNDLARQKVLATWEKGHSCEGLVILADRQTQGRGQHGRKWASPAGGLYFSAVVEQVLPDHRDKLALIAGVASARALLHSAAGDSPPIRLRWPNDLMLHGRKVGGILCEALAMGSGKGEAGGGGRWAGIIGIGINVNTPAESFPPDWRENAASLMDFDDSSLEERKPRVPYSLRKLLDEILRHLAWELKACRQNNFHRIIERVRELDALNGHALVLQTGATQLSGTAAGIDADGSLLLRISSDQPPISIQFATVLSVDGKPVRIPSSSRRLEFDD